MDKISIGYFLEDIAQEDFLKSLVARVAQEIGLAHQEVRHEVRNATGGQGMVLNELKRFLRDVGREREHPFALLVIAIDGNCRGYREKRDDILEIVERSGYPGPVVCAVPDPHIERWYLADSRGLQQVLDTDIVPKVPDYKCQRDLYKQALHEAIRRTGIIPLLGGVEYGSDIAENLDLYTVGRTDAGFKHFIDELRSGLAPFVAR